jgi:aryl-alcohol dehydrogenase-like predicted oxidoreductase
VDESTAASMIDLCLERGVNFVDTANAYGHGAAEKVLGRVLRGRRQQLVLASKVGIKMGESPDQIGLSPATITRQIDETLKRLGTDYLDIYYLHQPDYATPVEQTLEAISDLVREGKVRHLGASNYAAWQIVQMLWQADAKGLPAVQVTQPMFNLLARNIEAEFLPMCEAMQLATLVYNPLAGGLLTGKHGADQSPAAGTRFDGNESYQRRYWHRENFSALGRLADTAAAQGRSLVSLALGWLLHHTPIDGVILGASRREHLEQNLDACADGPLPAAAVDACDKVWRELRGISPQYNR